MTPREYLASLEFHGIKLGLENIKALLDGAGSPHEAYPIAHVAGTNGKGSVVATLDSIARAAGYHTGRFTSPHLIDVTERFLFDAQSMADPELDESISFYRDLAARMERVPTYFEMATAVALRWFGQRRVDLGIVEVGMGGRFDATNVVAPIATAITNIDLEHTRYLGDSLEKIAFEKAGILKQCVPAIVAETKQAPLEVILSRAAELSCPVRLAGRDYGHDVEGAPFAQEFTYESDRLRIGPVPMALHGAYQGANTAAAVAMAESLMEAFPRITRETIEAGVAAARWPCRLEKVMEDPPVIVDVAHNPAGARNLAAQIPECVIVIAVSSDKNAGEMIDALAPRARKLILTRFEGRRAMPVEELSALADTHPHEAVRSLADAIGIGIGLADRDTPLLVTGSIFTAGEARSILMDRHGAPGLRF